MQHKRCMTMLRCCPRTDNKLGTSQSPVDKPSVAQELSTQLCTAGLQVESGGAGARQAFEFGQEMHGVDTVFRVTRGRSAHLGPRLQAGANCRATRVAEQAATEIGIELHTGHAGRLAVAAGAIQIGNGAADAWGDAAGGAAGAAGKGSGGRVAGHGRIVEVPSQARVTIGFYRQKRNTEDGAAGTMQGLHRQEV